MKNSSFVVKQITNRIIRRRQRRNLYAGKYFSVKFFKFIFFGLAYCFFIVVAGLFALFLVLSPSAPSAYSLQHLMAAESSIIYDRNGEILYTIHGDENRKIIPLQKVSTNLINATLATEDDQFYNHIGIDIPGLFKAVCSEFRLCQRRGGSTITQQFAKNAFLTPERTYIRKLKEIFLALKLEARFSKDEILEMYLNRINYGSNIYGVELAAQTFFDKPAADLDLAEAAILAAIPKAPTYYSPYGGHKYAAINIAGEEVMRLNIQSELDIINHSPDFISKGLIGKTYIFGDDSRSIYIKGRIDFVLERMEEVGYITHLELQTALANAAAKEFQPFREAMLAPHFVLYVKELLEQKYGKNVLEKGGFSITTTLDAKLQKEAEEAVARYAEDNKNRLGVGNASLVAMDPENGQILAMVGSKDYWDDEIDGKVNVVLRPRMPGSSFKPIVYAAAFLKGLSPASMIYDVKTKFGDWYEPGNFDGTFAGPISIRQALAQSRNIPAVKTAYLTGISNVIHLARQMGIQLAQPDDWYGLSLAIGAGEVRLLDLTRAYGVLANGGYAVEPVSILGVSDKQGNILEAYEPPAEQKLVLDQQAAYLVTNILSDTQAKPEGFWRDILTIPGQIVAAKTGTSNKNRNPVANPKDAFKENAPKDNVPFDCWTLGYSRNLVAGVWAGNTDGSPLGPKADGLNAAGKIWHDFMVSALANVPAESFEKPKGLRFVEVSKRSGKLPSEFTPKADITTEIFASFSAPTETDNSYQVVEIDKASGKLATEFTPEPAREKRAYYTYHSELPGNPQWEEPVQAWVLEQKFEANPPTEYDDVHTAQSENVKPDIRIISPVAQATVALPYVGVIAEVNSPAGISQIDYYWDDALVESVKSPPYRGHLNISADGNSIGSFHVIKAVVFDNFYNSNQAAIEVKIGEDILAPVVNFVYPKPGMSVPAGSLMAAQVDAYDINGDIKKVEWYLQGELKTSTISVPYVWSFYAPDSPGECSIKAVVYDYAGKYSQTEIILNVSSQNFSGFSGVSRLILPTANQSFGPGDSVVIKAYLDETTRANFKNIIIFAKQDKVSPIQIAQCSKMTSSPFYTFIWPAPATGKYELFLKIILKNGEVLFSERAPITMK